MPDSIPNHLINHADYAGFAKRFFAACLDMLLYTPFYYYLNKWLGYSHLVLSESLFFVFALVTYSLFFASKWQASPAMYLLKFHVTDEEGRRISFRRAVYWGIVGSIGWALCFAGVIYMQSNFDIYSVRDIMQSCQENNIAVPDCNKEIESEIHIPVESFQQICFASLGLAAFLSFIWALSIIVPKDKTGFHNLICGTRFVNGRV